MNQQRRREFTEPAQSRMPTETELAEMKAERERAQAFNLRQASLGAALNYAATQGPGGVDANNLIAIAEDIYSFLNGDSTDGQ